jgi:hypothetical protein
VALIPQDVRVHSARELAFVGLGRRAEAEEEGRRLQESLVQRRDACEGPELAKGWARILAGIGETDAALAESVFWLGRPASAFTSSAWIPSSIPSARTHASRPSW